MYAAQVVEFRICVNDSHKLILVETLSLNLPCGIRHGGGAQDFYLVHPNVLYNIEFDHYVKRTAGESEFAPDADSRLVFVGIYIAALVNPLPVGPVLGAAYIHPPRKSYRCGILFKETDTEAGNGGKPAQPEHDSTSGAARKTEPARIVEIVYIADNAIRQLRLGVGSVVTRSRRLAVYRRDRRDRYEFRTDKQIPYGVIRVFPCGRIGYRGNFAFRVVAHFNTSSFT